MNCGSEAVELHGRNWFFSPEVSQRREIGVIHFSFFLLLFQCSGYSSIFTFLLFSLAKSSSSPSPSRPIFYLPQLSISRSSYPQKHGDSGTNIAVSSSVSLPFIRYTTIEHSIVPSRDLEPRTIFWSFCILRYPHDLVIVSNFLAHSLHPS